MDPQKERPVVLKQPEQTGLHLSGVYLPEELLERVAMHAASDFASVKRLRKTCKSFARVSARYVFHTVHIAPIKENLEWLITISSDERLAKYVKKVVYSHGSLQQFNSRRNSQDCIRCSAEMKYRDDTMLTMGEGSYEHTYGGRVQPVTYCPISHLESTHGPDSSDHRYGGNAQLSCLPHSLAMTGKPNNADSSGRTTVSSPSSNESAQLVFQSMNREGDDVPNLPRIHGLLARSPAFKVLSELEVDLDRLYPERGARSVSALDQLAPFLLGVFSLETLAIRLSHDSRYDLLQHLLSDNSRSLHTGTWPRLKEVALASFDTTAKHLSMFLQSIAPSLRSLDLASINARYTGSDLSVLVALKDVLVALPKNLNLEQVHLSLLTEHGGMVLAGKPAGRSGTRMVAASCMCEARLRYEMELNHRAKRECHWKAFEDYILRRTAVVPQFDLDAFMKTHQDCGVRRCQAGRDISGSDEDSESNEDSESDEDSEFDEDSDSFFTTLGTCCNSIMCRFLSQ